MQYLLSSSYAHQNEQRELNYILSKLLLRKTLIVFTADIPW